MSKQPPVPQHAKTEQRRLSRPRVSAPSLPSLYRHPPPEPRTIGGGPGSSGGRSTLARPAAAGAHSCNCKRSNCLKLYCECFANGVYCAQSRGCRCEGCYNNADGESTRREAIDLILDRNPHGFRPKIVEDGLGWTGDGGGGGAAGGQPAAPLVKREGVGVEALLLCKGEETAGASAVVLGGEGMTRHQRGCHCKRSHCRKKYCECFQAGVACTEKCRCTDCENTEGSLIESKPPPPPTPPPSSPVKHHQQQQHLFLGIDGSSSSPSSSGAGHKRARLLLAPQDGSATGAQGAAAAAAAAAATAAAAAAAARGPAALLPSMHRAKLEANVANLLRAMRPQMTEDLVMLMVNAAWEEGLAFQRQQQRPPPPVAKEQEVEEAMPASAKRKRRDEGEDGGQQPPAPTAVVDADLGCAEELRGLDGDGDGGNMGGQAEEGEGEKKGRERTALAAAMAEEGGQGAAPAGSPAAVSAAAVVVQGQQRVRQELSVLMHLNAGLRRLVELVARGKATGGGGGVGVGGGSGGTMGGLGGGGGGTSTYAYARRMV